MARLKDGRRVNIGFPDNSSRLFGRSDELSYLIERSQRRGVTIVIGQPQMGKSWQLLEVARRLSTEGWPGPALGGDASVPLLGRVESEGEAADMLPRAVQDLYTRWLSDSTYREQARVVFEQQKGDFIGRVGEAVGSLVESVVKTHGLV